MQVFFSEHFLSKEKLRDVVVAQQTKPRSLTVAAYLGTGSFTPFPIQFPANGMGKRAEDDPNIWAPATRVRPGEAQLLWPFQGLNQQTQGLFLSFSPSL